MPVSHAPATTVTSTDESALARHWIIARGDDGIDAMLANQSKQMKKWLEKPWAPLWKYRRLSPTRSQPVSTGSTKRKPPVSSPTSAGRSAVTTCTGSTDLEPDSPPVGGYKQHLHRSVRRIPPDAATRPHCERSTGRALPDLGTASLRPSAARPVTRARAGEADQCHSGHPRPSCLLASSSAASRRFRPQSAALQTINPASPRDLTAAYE
jgi:hypothetical protein